MSAPLGPAGDAPFFGQGSPFAESELEGQGDSGQAAGSQEEDDWQPPTREESDQWHREAQEAQEREARANDQLEANNRLMREVLAGRPAAGAQNAGPTTLDELGAMPDAATHPAEFQKWLEQSHQITNRTVVRTLQGFEQRQEQSRKAEGLFDELVRRHPVMAGKRWMAVAAAEEAGVTSADAGETILRKTIERLRLDGAISDDLDAAARNGSGGRPPAPAGGRPSGANRTGGVGGGSGTRRPRPSRRDEERQPVDLVDAITDDQAKLGIL